MKIKLISLKNLLLFALLCITLQGNSQNRFVASGDIFGNRVFIKNNGQFNNILPNNKEVLYGYVNSDEQVYFSNQGLTYLLQKKKPLSHEEFEKIEHGKKIKRKATKKYFVSVNWENSNPNAEIIVDEKQTFYHSFGDEKYKSDCFKKITYKNIYNNIDIEYVFTNEKENGIKYNVILYPGANLEDVKIKYSGDIKKLILKNGNVIIKTPIIDITELAPNSFQNDLKLESNFKLDNNIISFNFPNGYDKNQKITIDPWVINISFANNNYAYDVDYDYAGNFYAYGGSGPFLISKFSPTGSLIWTFDGVVPSANWFSNPVINYPSNFIVDKVSGKSYTGQGFNYGTQIIRIDAFGIYDNFISLANPAWEEIWDMGYSCGDGTIFGLGGGTTSNVSAGILNTTTASINPQSFTGLSSAGQDIVSHTIDSNGVVYFLYASSFETQTSNALLRVNSSFDGNSWFTSTGYTTFEELGNKIYPGSGLSYPSSNGFNALAVNNNFLFYYDGYNLKAYNKNTGIGINEIQILGLTARYQGGIAVDECNNIYIGGNGSILCYNFNGTSFTPNGTIPVASTTANKYITDIKLKSGTNELYVTGSGFCGIYIAINSSSCSTTSSINVTSTLVSPNNSTAVATIVTTVTTPLITYTWLNASNTIVSQTINSSSSTNTVNNLVNGTYTVLAQINAPCGPTVSQTIITNSSTTTITPTFTAVLPICSGTILSPLPTTSNNNITGTWSPALNNTLTTTYTFTPAIGQDATTVTLTIIVTPIVTPTFSAVNPICEGTVLAALPTTSNNGITGTWSPALNNLTTTTYLFTPTTGLCASTTTLQIVVNPKITPTFDPIAPICFGGIVPTLPSISLNGISGTWSPTTVSNTLTGDYIFTPNAGECSLLPPSLSVTVFEDFNFTIIQDCVDKKFTLEVVPIGNSFDASTAFYTWEENSNVIVNSNNSILNVTDYINSNSIIVNLPLSFNVTVLLPNGCYKSQNLSVAKIYCDIQKGISPNGDNLNEFFDLELLDVKKLTIFNRYGMKVYSKDNYSTQWIGQSNSGKELPDGTYYYLIDFDTVEPSVTGWIYINREIK
ncbi:gliding motility-associated C-terminal domain-containing protein [Flavobacterium sp.]|uniref:DUF7948 domain-containing protein n=1 Tax=Flavobacterium sp. TaxID=239 RepID=UPI003753025D